MFAATKSPATDDSNSDKNNSSGSEGGGSSNNNNGGNARPVSFSAPPLQLQQQLLHLPQQLRERIAQAVSNNSSSAGGVAMSNPSIFTSAGVGGSGQGHESGAGPTPTTPELKRASNARSEVEYLLQRHFKQKMSREGGGGGAESPTNSMASSHSSSGVSTAASSGAASASTSTSTSAAMAGANEAASASTTSAFSSSLLAAKKKRNTKEVCLKTFMFLLFEAHGLLARERLLSVVPPSQLTYFWSFDRSFCFFREERRWGLDDLPTKEMLPLPRDN